jgi:hypothetical protein
MNKKTFISYSKRDSDIVQAITKLLQTQGNEVFVDYESIKPGEKWRESLQKAIERSDQLILFWCCHSGKSEWVKYEFEQGTKLGKPIIPVLCCDYPADDEVGEFQWIDVRPIIKHQCFDHEKTNPKNIINNDRTAPPPPMPSPTRSSGQKRWIWTGLTVAIIFGFSLFWLLPSRTLDHPGPGGTQTDTSHVTVIVLFAALLLLAIFGLIRLRSYFKEQRSRRAKSKYFEFVLTDAIRQLEQDSPTRYYPPEKNK